MCRASNAEYELSRDLLDGYDFRVRPVRHHSDVLDVSMKVVLQQIISVDSKSQFIELNLWLQYVSFICIHSYYS
ncbi:hypothetical protein AB6A40_011305 [Gnathostoma spinigerum]|uniref:Neurotransmitter-gated ion-channel ligand-binding domain-containing protein n=1 Tax=Gnathostoma spinigerum TaxID=75299 RepID=A0ABD6F2R1_9BILA